ncbi:MAG: YkgJ family cysteine cluster protein [Planctomycetes bacterium]|nr:YkgJ family cysteine cluster protein [Planctomycetota bacterium]
MAAMQQKAARIALAGGATPENIAAMVADAHARAEFLIEQTAETVELPPRACCAGCAYCCHLWVVVPIAEVVLIALRARAANDGAADVQAKLERRVAEVRGLTAEQRSRTRVPCLWLDPTEQTCRIYGLRPLVCRGWHSFDLEKCKQAHRHPTQNIETAIWSPQRTITESVAAGMLAATQQLGLPGGYVHLVEGLQIALGDPAAIERWLAGEDVFRPAAVSAEQAAAACAAC